MIVLLLKRMILLYCIFFIPNTFAQFSFFNINLDSNQKQYFKNDNEKIGYALGVSLGDYVNQSFEKQKKIGINLDKNHLVLGIQDAISGNLKISHEGIVNILKNLEEKLQHAKTAQLEQSERENLAQKDAYMKRFSEMKGVKKTPNGLLYLIEDFGSGQEVKNTSKITVHYKGSLINGEEFDNSYKRGQPITLLLKDVILGWQEGLKHIKKGGKIKLIIPPHLGYGKNRVNGIPGNSILIFDIDLLDVQTS